MIGLVTNKLGAFGDIINDIATSLLKMVTNRLLMKLVDAMLGTSPVAGGRSGGGGFNLGSLFGGGGSGGGGGLNLGGLFGGIRPTSTTFPMQGGFNLGNLFASGGAGIASGLSGSSIADVFGSQYGSNIGSGDTFSGRASQAQMLQGLLLGGGSKPISTILGSTGTLGGNLALSGALLAPFAGAGIGGMLGGQSRAGSLLGMVGGGVLGAAGSVALLGGSGAAIFGTGGALSGLGGAAALLTNPFTIAAGGALLVGAYFLGRNKRRREEETTRDQAIRDATGQLDKLIQQVRSHQIDPASALSQASQIREQYMTEMGKLKDKKTRNHALATVRDIDYRIGVLRGAATNALNDNSRRNITAAFATGGIVPGQKGEPRLVLAHGGEVIASLSQQTPALMQAASEAGIPGVAGNSGGGAGRHVSVNVELVVGTKTQNEMFVNGAKSEEGYNVQLKNTKKALKYDI